MPAERVLLILHRPRARQVLQALHDHGPGSARDVEAWLGRSKGSLAVELGALTGGGYLTKADRVGRGAAVYTAARPVDDLTSITRRQHRQIVSKAMTLGTGRKPSKQIDIDRAELAADVEAFLARGGTITEVVTPAPVGRSATPAGTGSARD